MPQRVSTRGGSARRSRSAGTSRDNIMKEGSFLSQDAIASEQLQDLSLKLNSESIQSVTIGDEEFEMLMLDGYNHHFLH